MKYGTIIYGTITHDGVGNKIICRNDKCQSEKFYNTMDFPYAVCVSCGYGGTTR